jgi:hypothetical protein
MSKASRHIIISGDPGRLGKTRGEQHENLKKEGWSAGLSVEQEDKCKYLERKHGIKDRFLKLNDLDKVR